MKKLAIVLDSFCGLDKKYVESNENIFFVSLQIEIENKVFQEGYDIVNLDVIEKVKNGVKASTSLPSLSIVKDLIEKLSNEYKNVIILPIAKHMSGTHDLFLNYTKEYKNMQVIDNQFVGDTYLDVSRKAIAMFDSGSNISGIVSFIKEVNEKTIGFIIPDNLVSLINSGRLKGIKKHIISSSNLSLIIKVSTKLSFSGIGRTKTSAIKKIFNKLDKFCTDNVIVSGYVYKLFYSHGVNNLNIAKEYMKANGIRIGAERKTSLSVLVHSGYGALYIGVTPKILF
ncbi:MAG: DegV family protein [Mycoplasmataceae bacterium]|nr:DegV family protein [Mycoplasmataceae bacterium]